jgi:plasmid stabilization system protein ParE
MSDAIEQAIHLLRQAAQTATTDTDATRALVAAAVNALAPLVATPEVGPDDIPGTSTRRRTS